MRTRLILLSLMICVAWIPPSFAEVSAPICPAGQMAALTPQGTFSCAYIPQVPVPNCAAGQMPTMTPQGTFSCIRIP